MTRVEFAKLFPTEYKWLAKHKRALLDKCIPIVWNRWDKDSCKKEASKYKTRKEWQKGSGGSYREACKNAWFDECYKHMEGWISEQYYTEEIPNRSQKRRK